MAKLAKRYAAAVKNVEAEKAYSLAEAVKIVKGNAKAKFDETIELVVNLGVDPKQNDQNVRAMVTLPNGTGKNIRVAVICKAEKVDAAKAAGAEFAGAEDLAEQIEKGMMDFDRLIASPDMMMVVGRLGKVLGPRGLMPNPKLGTVTPNVAEAVKAAKGGAIEFRAEKAGIVHAGVGKASFSEQAIEQNIRALMSAITKAKPAGAKGNYIQKASLSSTMGPGVKLDLTTLTESAGA